jgi:hypothetical protein
MAESPLGRLVDTWEFESFVEAGRWESSPEGTTWELDFQITYRKTS